MSYKELLNFLVTFWSRFRFFYLKCTIHAASYNFVCLYLPTRKDPRFLFFFHCAITNKARKLLSRNNDGNRLLRKSMTSECEMKARCRHRFVLVWVVQRHKEWTRMEDSKIYTHASESSKTGYSNRKINNSLMSNISFMFLIRKRNKKSCEKLFTWNFQYLKRLRRSVFDALLSTSLMSLIPNINGIKG